MFLNSGCHFWMVKKVNLISCGVLLNFDNSTILLLHSNSSLRERSNISRFAGLKVVPWELGVSTQVFGLHPNQITAALSKSPFPAPNRMHLSFRDSAFLWYAKHSLLRLLTSACCVILYHDGTRNCLCGLPQILQLHANECFSVIIEAFA